MSLAQQKRDFMDFVDQMGYMPSIRSMVSKEERRLLLNVDDLRSFNRDLALALMRSPAEYLPAFEEALREIVTNHDPSFAKQGAANEFRIGVVGSFGAHHVSPRQLGSALLNSVVRVEGIVTKCSLVRPKVVMSKHWCPTTKQFTTKQYRDLTSLTGAATGSAYPTKDSDGNLLETEYGLCEYMDCQTVHLQEMPERAPPGQLPRSVEVILEADLVDSTKPGDRLHITGIHRALPSKANQSGTFKTLVLGNHVRLLTKHLGSAQFTEEDVRHIKEVSRRPDALPLLAESVAPSVFGHDFEKRALLLMLLGGTERNLANGTHLRGDINILMLGDPSTAKSQLLRAVMRTAPLAISTTGRGSSGVGLTAAVTSDEETGAKRLEAGAMVLADRGVCCVDEFDKMVDADRVAIHEVMEQQTVTIAKAGMHASLNARCSVVAAANPVWGSYDKNQSAMANIGMPDSLLSRFDLLFIILDKKEEASDRRIAAHVLSQHAAPPPPASLSSANSGNAGARGGSHAGASEEGVTSDVFTRPDARKADDDERQRLTSEFIKKYIHYAKAKCSPQMSDDAAATISAAYADLRQKVSTLSKQKFPVTARTLETMIRLASAHAKAHLRGLVQAEDAKAAIAMLHFAIFHEDENEDELAGAKEGASERGGGGGSGDGDGDDDDDDARGPGGSQPPSRADRAAQRSVRRGEEEERAEGGAGGAGAASSSGAGASSGVLDERSKEAVGKGIADVFGNGDAGVDECSFEELLAKCREHKRNLTVAAFSAALEYYETENRVMHRDGVVHGI